MEEIQQICRFFDLGRPLHFENKMSGLPHAHGLGLAKTSKGKFVIKCYPAYAAQRISLEYAINRILTQRRFPTPAMHAGPPHRPFCRISHQLFCCYDFIDGDHAWQSIQSRDTFRQINGNLIGIKNTLAPLKGRLPFLRQESLAAKIKDLSQKSKILKTYDHKNLIEGHLKNICRAFESQRRAFARQWLHNCATLTNFLKFKSKIYVIDLEHVREDYVLADLASLVLSCLSVDVKKDVPLFTIQAVIKDHYAQLRPSEEDLAVVRALFLLGLVKEYLHYIRACRLPGPASQQLSLKQARAFHLLADSKALTKLWLP